MTPSTPESTEHADRPGAAPEAETDRRAALYDLVTYAVATTLVFSAVSVVLGSIAGMQPLPAVKYGLFVFGWLALGYGTVLLRPTAAWDDEEHERIDFFDRSSGKPDTAFQRFVQRMPPARFRQAPDEARFSTGARIMFGAVVMMVTSIVLEQVFGIGP